MQAIILKYTASAKNSLGQKTYEHVESDNIDGFLDLLAGSEKDRANSLSDSTHVFITKNIDCGLSNQDRLLINSKEYEVTFVDDPVNIGHHLEIFLKVAS